MAEAPMDLFELIGSSDEHVRLKAIERAALEGGSYGGKS
jgi:hypothetical protein